MKDYRLITTLSNTLNLSIYSTDSYSPIIYKSDGKNLDGFDILFDFNFECTPVMVLSVGEQKDKDTIEIKLTKLASVTSSVAFSSVTDSFIKDLIEKSSAEFGSEFLLTKDLDVIGYRIMGNLNNTFIPTDYTLSKLKPITDDREFIQALNLYISDGYEKSVARITTQYDPRLFTWVLQYKDNHEDIAMNNLKIGSTVHYESFVSFYVLSKLTNESINSKSLSSKIVSRDSFRFISTFLTHISDISSKSAFSLSSVDSLYDAFSTHAIIPLVPVNRPYKSNIFYRILDSDKDTTIDVEDVYDDILPNANGIYLADLMQNKNLGELDRYIDDIMKTDFIGTARFTIDVGKFTFDNVIVDASKISKVEVNVYDGAIWIYIYYIDPILHTYGIGTELEDILNYNYKSPLYFVDENLTIEDDSCYH